MFRVQDNLPEVYINESRDFQLISRLYDVLFSGVKYDIDSMVNVLDATLTKDTMLQLMCSKVGFFPRFEIDAQVLKYIIASFPFIVKNKGNKRGIEYAINAILKAENNPSAIGKPYIVINNNVEEGYRKPYTVYIYTTVTIYNKVALDEVMRYVLPIGSTYQILAYNKLYSGVPTKITQTDKINVVQLHTYRDSVIRDIEESNYGNIENKSSLVVGDIDGTYVVSDINDVNKPTIDGKEQNYNFDTLHDDENFIYSQELKQRGADN